MPQKYFQALEGSQQGLFEGCHRVLHKSFGYGTCIVDLEAFKGVLKVPNGQVSISCEICGGQALSVRLLPRKESALSGRPPDAPL